MKTAYPLGNARQRILSDYCRDLSRLEVVRGLERKDGGAMHWCGLLTGDYAHMCRRAHDTAGRTEMAMHVDAHSGYSVYFSYEKDFTTEPDKKQENRYQAIEAQRPRKRKGAQCRR